MKNKVLIAALAAALALVGSAKTEDPYMTVGTTQYSAKAEGETITIPVLSNIPWTVTSSSSFVKVTPNAQADAAEVVIDANDTFDSRSATITFSGKAVEPVPVAISQAGKDKKSMAVADASGAAIKSIETPFTESETVVTVTTDATTWDATASSNWITVTKEGNSVKIALAENTTASDREAKVTFDGDGVYEPVTIKVNQWKMDKATVEVLAQNYHKVLYSVTTDASVYTRTMLFGKASVDEVGVRYAGEYIVAQLNAFYEQLNAKYPGEYTLKDILETNCPQGNVEKDLMEDLDPATEYTLVTVPLAIFGGELVMTGVAFAASFTTDAQPEADAAYEAMLGEWTIPVEIYEEDPQAAESETAKTVIKTDTSAVWKAVITEDDINDSYFITFDECCDITGATEFHMYYSAEDGLVSIPTLVYSPDDRWNVGGVAAQFFITAMKLDQWGYLDTDVKSFDFKWNDTFDTLTAVDPDHPFVSLAEVGEQLMICSDVVRISSMTKSTSATPSAGPAKVARKGTATSSKSGIATKVTASSISSKAIKSGNKALKAGEATSKAVASKMAE